MNRILKLRQTDASKVYMTSDWHLFHNPMWPVPIWKMRGFNSLDESNDFIVDSINETVSANDHMFNLGDPSLNCTESQFEELLSKIQCQNIYLMWGNHASPSWKIYQREIDKINKWRNISNEEIEIYPFRYRNLIFIGNYAEIVVDGQFICLSHYPMNSWNNMAKGSIHCHGHIHSTKETYKFEGKKIDVGMDYHMKPVSFNEIRKILSKLEIKHEGHH